MSGSSPNPDLPFFGNFVYFCVVLFAVYVSKKKLKKEMGREVGFFYFFQLDKTPPITTV